MSQVKPVGRFWGRGSSEEESEEEVTESESSEDEEEEKDEEEASEKDDSSKSSKSASSEGNSFLISDSETESDEREKVKPERVRRMEELRDICEEMKQKIYSNDWIAIQLIFIKLNSQLERTMKAIGDGKTPKKYLRILVKLEIACLTIWNDTEKKAKLNKSNYKALSIMKNRIFKNNKMYEKELELVRAEPLSSGESEAGSEDLSESESGEEEEKEEFGAGGKKQDKILSMAKEDITFEMVSDKLKEIMLSRGKRGSDKQERIEMLQYLLTVAKGSIQTVIVLSHLISSLFDLNQNMMSQMKTSHWKLCTRYCFQLLDILEENPHIKIEDNINRATDLKEEPEPGTEVRIFCTILATIERLDDELFKSLQIIDPHTHSYLERLQDETYFLALAQKMCNYITNTSEMKGLSKVTLRLIEHYYYKTQDVYNSMRRLVIMRQQQDEEEKAIDKKAKNKIIDKITYGDDDYEDKIEEDENDNDFVSLKIPAYFTMEETVFEALDNLTQVIFEMGDEREKARAMLTNIYNKSIHGNFNTAKDWMLMSHTHETIGSMDISTQILYNRTIAQMGLAAFRLGLISDAHSCLTELYSAGKVKELLAQGVTMNRYQEKTPEQEKLERRRQMPFHMHINLELLESVHLISAMLLEVPSIAASSFSTTHRTISKPFSWLLENYSGHTFSGPPENVKDHVVASTKAMLMGDWKTAYKYASDLNCWNLIAQKDHVLDILKTKIKEESLRTYLFSYSDLYSSLSQEQLCQMFDLSREKVHSIVSQMIINDEIHGAWDQPTSTIVIHNTEASKIQTLAIQFTDKVNNLLEMNERVVRSGNIHDDEEQGRRKGHWDEEGTLASKQKGHVNRAHLKMVRGGAGRGRGRGRGQGWNGGMQQGASSQENIAGGGAGGNFGSGFNKRSSLPSLSSLNFGQNKRN